MQNKQNEITNKPILKHLNIKDINQETISSLGNDSESKFQIQHQKNFDNNNDNDDDGGGHEFNLESDRNTESKVKPRNSIKVNLQRELQNVKIEEQELTTTKTPKKAIPFIKFNADNDSGSFALTQEAIDFLSQIDSNIAVVSVAGLYRTGKSYLLNKVILNKGDSFETNPFQVGPTISACTKGLWLYPEVVRIINKNNEHLNLVVIDTEGIGATDEDCNHDTKIFALALLISSYFIYNSIGSIDENALSNLSFVSNLAKHIQVNNDNKPFLPSFLWVLRDFSLRLVDEFGSPITTKEYLEKSLKITTSNPNLLFSNAKSANKNASSAFLQKTLNKNSIREHLQNYFQERDCVALIRPTIDESNLQNLNEKNLRPEFIEQSKALSEKIQRDMKAKELRGRKLSGELFISMVQTYVNSINSGEIPSIESAFSDLAKYELKHSVRKAVSKFEESVAEVFYNNNKNDNNKNELHFDEKTDHFSAEKPLLPMEEESVLLKLEIIHRSAKSLILKHSDYNSFSSIEDCLNQFELEVKAIKNNLLSDNKRLAIESMNLFLEEHFCFNSNINNKYFKLNNNNNINNFSGMNLLFSANQSTQPCFSKSTHRKQHQKNFSSLNYLGCYLQTNNITSIQEKEYPSKATSNNIEVLLQPSNALITTTYNNNNNNLVRSKEDFLAESTNNNNIITSTVAADDDNNCYLQRELREGKEGNNVSYVSEDLEKLELYTNNINDNNNTNSNNINYVVLQSFEFLNYIDDFRDFALRKGPKGPFLREVLIDFLYTKTKEYFHSSSQSINELLELFKEKLGKENSSLKAELEKARSDLASKEELFKFSVKQLQQELESSKSLSSITQSNLEEKLRKLQDENQKLEARIQSLVAQNKSASLKLEEISKQKTDDLEAKLSEAKESVLIKDKELLLSTQRIKQLEEENKRLNEKARELALKVSLCETPSNNNSKKPSALLTEKLEAQIKSLNSKAEIMQETNISLETKLLEKEKRLENEKAKYEELKEEYSKKLFEWEEECTVKEKALVDLREAVTSTSEAKQREFNELLESVKCQFTNRQSALEKQRADKEEELLASKKELLSMQQNTEFLNFEMTDLKELLRGKELDILTKQQEIVRMSKENNAFRESVKQEKQCFEIQMSALKEELEAIVLREKKNKQTAEEQLNLKVSELNLELSNYKSKLANSQKQVKALSEEAMELKTLNTNLTGEHSSMLLKHKEALETALSKENEKYEKMLKQIREEAVESNLKSKQQIEDFRVFFENEKREAEKRLEETVLLHKKELEALRESHGKELLLREQEYNEAIEDLHTDIEESNAVNKEYLEQINSEASNYKSTIELLQSSNSQLNRSLESLREMHLSALANLQNSFINDKNTFSLKFDEANKQILILEKEKSFLESKVSHLNETIEKHLDTITRQSNDNRTIIERLQEEIGSKNLETKELQGKVLQSTIQNSTSEALRKQELQFKEAKITELNETISLEKQLLSQKQKEIRLEIENEFKSTIDNLFNEKQESEEKIVALKKEHLKSEANLKALKAGLEKELAVLNEKYINAMRIKEELLNTTEKEREKMLSEIEKLKLSKKTGKAELLEQIELLKQVVNTKDNTIKEITSKLDSTQNNSNSKALFYENANRETKSSYQEQLKSLEKKICDLKQEFTEEKERLENIYFEKATKLESLYKEQIRELKAEGTLVASELSSKIQELNEENKKLVEKLEGVKEESTLIKQETEERLRKEFERTMKELAFESNSKASKETSSLKEKYDEYVEKVLKLEKKCLEYENRENLLYLTTEKLKSDYQKRIESLLSKIEKLKGQTSILEKEKEESSKKTFENIKEAMMLKTKSKENAIPKMMRDESPKCFVYSSNNKENNLNRMNTMNVVNTLNSNMNTRSLLTTKNEHLKNKI